MPGIPASGGALYRLEDVRVVREGRAILDVTSLEIASGGIVAVTGPNGAGKSTLLRLLALLAPPDHGTLRFADSIVGPGAPPPLELRRRATLVAQDPYLFSGTVLSNAAWGLVARGMPAHLARARAELELGSVGLKDFFKRKARSLSGGEVRRLAIARALALDPLVLLLDEPGANLDAEPCQLVDSAIRKASRERGASVVFSTHEPAQALRLASRRLAMGFGRIAEDRAEVVLSGEIAESGGRTVFRSSGIDLVIPGGPPGPAAASLDPAAVIIALEAPRTSAQNALPGRIASISREGDRVRVAVDAGIMIEALLTPASAEVLELAPGLKVYAVFKANSVRLL